MDKAALVAADFAAGSKIVSALTDAGLRLNVAMWLRTPEYEDWRFLLSSRDLDDVGPVEAYGSVHDKLERTGLQLEHTPPLLILPQSDPFVKELRQIFGKAKSVEGMRLGGQSVGGRFIEDAIVYRIQ